VEKNRRLYVRGHEQLKGTTLTPRWSEKPADTKRFVAFVGHVVQFESDGDDDQDQHQEADDDNRRRERDVRLAAHERVVDRPRLSRNNA